MPTRDLVRSGARHSDFVQAVQREIQFQSDIFGTRYTSRLIYFGGGTPSVLSAAQLATLLDALGAFVPSASFTDATIEASPETVDLSKLRDLRRAGFDRISFGVQSFNDARLKSVGRSHDASQAVRAVKQAQQAGFEDINIDLILGFPGETDREWDLNIAQATALAPDHLSIYLFRRSPGTLMSRRASPAPPDELVRRYARTTAVLGEQGYEEYLFQLFGRAGRRCNADLTYFGLEADYLGFGAGAHSLVDGQFFGHRADLADYLTNPCRPSYTGPAREARSALATKAFEMMHTPRGLDWSRFRDRLGLTAEEASAQDPHFRSMIEHLRRAHGVEEDEAGLRFFHSDDRTRWFAQYS